MLRLKFIRKTKPRIYSDSFFYRFNRSSIKTTTTATEHDAAECRQTFEWSEQNIFISMNGGYFRMLSKDSLMWSLYCIWFYHTFSSFFTHSSKSNIKSFSKWSHWRGIAFYCWIITTKKGKNWCRIYTLCFGIFDLETYKRAQMSKTRSRTHATRISLENKFFGTWLNYHSKWNNGLLVSILPIRQLNWHHVLKTCQN